jgi:hypothetical protein
MTGGRNGKWIEGRKRTGRTRSDFSKVAKGYRGNAKMSGGSLIDLPSAARTINKLAHRRV